MAAKTRTPDIYCDDLPPEFAMTRRSAGWARPAGYIDDVHDSYVFPGEPPFDIPILKAELMWPTHLWQCAGKVERKTAPGDYVHFYTDDCRMVPIWRRPKTYLSVLQQVGGLLTPDFSLRYETPRSIHIWNVHRNRWMGAYYQAWGLRVIPSVRWTDRQSWGYAFAGLPRGGLIAVSTQSLRGHVHEDDFEPGLRRLLELVRPAGLVVYGTRVELPDLGVEMRYYPTHMELQERYARGEGQSPHLHARE